MKMRSLSVEEARRIRDGFGGRFASRDRALWVLGCGTGYRISELLSLDLDVVAMAAGQAVPRVRVSRARMKGRRRSRDVPMPTAARRALVEYFEGLPVLHRRQGMPLFQTAAGGRLSRVQAYQAIRRAAKQAGVDVDRVGTHSMRKTYATRIYQAAVRRLAKGEEVDPIREAMRCLGHTSVATTEAYMAEPDDAADRYLDLMEGLFDGC